MRLAAILIFIALCACGPSPSAVSPLGQLTQAPGLAIQAVSAQQTSNAISAQATQAAARVEQAQAAIVQATANAQAIIDEHNFRMTVAYDEIKLAKAQSDATQAAIETQRAISEAVKLAAAKIDTERQLAGYAILSADAKAKQDQRWADFWDGALNIILVVLFGLVCGLSYVAITQFREWLAARVAIKQAEAKRAQVEWRTVEYRGQTIEIGWAFPANGIPYQLLPEARVVDQDNTDADKRAEAWKTAVSRFATYGGNGPFTFDRLGPLNSRSKPGDGMGIVSRSSWDLLTEYMISNGWLKSGGEGSKTDWAAGWGKERFFREVMHGESGLPPFPQNGKPPPDRR